MRFRRKRWNISGVAHFPKTIFFYVWKIVHFGKTICYAAEIGESEGQTGKRQDVEFGKKQGRRISPSSGLCSPLLEMSTIEIIPHLSSNFLWKAQKWGMLWVLLTDKASVNFTRNTEITTIWTVTLDCFLYIVEVIIAVMIQTGF